MSWKKFFCKHKYKYLGKWPCTIKYEDGTVVGVPITFLECPICGKRKVLRDSMFCYNTEVKNYITLWEKGQVDLEFDGEERNE